MKKIHLTTDSTFFRSEQFDTEVFCGRETPIMSLYEEDALSESVIYSPLSLDYEVMPFEKAYDEKGRMRKYLCVTDSFYIIAERGEKGFETSFSYFLCKIKMDDDNVTVIITNVDDDLITNAICESYLESEFATSDMFSERVIDDSRRHYINYTPTHLKALEGTEFIHIPFRSNLRKIGAEFNSEGKFFLKYGSGFKSINTGNDVNHNIEIGTPLYRRDENIRNLLEIAEVKQYSHDFYGNFWAVVEVIYSYPQDAEKIKATYPLFYEKECMSDACYKKKMLLEKSKELPHIREDFRIGDGIIHIPVETTSKEISIPLGDFHFIVEGDAYLGHLTHRGKDRLRLNSLPTLCSLVEVDRRYKLVYYDTTGFVKFNDMYFAELKFKRQSEFFDSMDAELITLQDYGARIMDKRALAIAGFLMYRGLIKPVEIAKETLGNITDK